MERSGIPVQCNGVAFHRLVRLFDLLLRLPFLELVVPIGQVVDVLDDGNDKTAQIICLFSRNSYVRRMRRKVSESVQLLAPVKQSLVNQSVVFQFPDAFAKHDRALWTRWLQGLGR